MKFTSRGEMELAYVGPSLDFVDYGTGGQFYGSLEGAWSSDRINGRLRLTNIAQKRPDNVNTPMLRGVMRTDDGATLFMEMNGLSQIQLGGRVFIASLTLRTGDPRYEWANTFFAVVEGELHGRPRPNEFRARCRVYECETTLTPVSEGGDRSMQPIAYVMAVLPGREGEVRSFVHELESRSREYGAYRRHRGVTREAVFLQRTPQGSQVITYREPVKPSSAQPSRDGDFERWLRDRMVALHGFDPTTGPQPTVELLIRQPPSRQADLYAAALPVRPGKMARLHEWTSELNGIHAAEFEESLHRLGFGLTLFVQYGPPTDVVIAVVEGDDPATALGRLVGSQHPFDRWHVQQIADQTGLDFSAPPAAPNELLWSLRDVAVGSRT